MESKNHIFVNIYSSIESGNVILKNNTTGEEIPLKCNFSKRQIAIIKAGGLLAYTKGE